MDKTQRQQQQEQQQQAVSKTKIYLLIVAETKTNRAEMVFELIASETTSLQFIICQKSANGSKQTNLVAQRLFVPRHLALDDASHGYKNLSSKIKFFELVIS